jgi:hypothetical protein
VSLQALVDGKLPKDVLDYAKPPEAWVSQ